MKKIYSIFILLFLFVISTSNVYASEGGYTIDSYDVEINVGEDNVLNVIEKIGVYFYEYRHGIYRNIPVRGKIHREDGSEETYKASVSNIKVSESYSKSYEYTGDNGYAKLQIGSANTTIMGRRDYTIQYSYRLSSNKSKDFDELYYNIIGTEWDTSIDNITFTITMPKEFDVEKLGFTHGKYGANYTDNIEYEISGNKITGKYIGTLEAYNGLTVRLELPEGYFTSSSLLTPFEQILICIFILAAVISLILWFKNGRDKIVVETVEFYPPDDLNSLELGYAYKKRAAGSDVTSLLIYLANKGYLKIEEKNEKFSNNSFEIIKLKEYDGNNELERKFFNGLFERGDNVTLDDLKDRFYVTQYKILRAINCKENKEKIITKESIISKIANIFISLLIFILLVVFIYFSSFDGATLLFFFPFIFFGFGAIISGVVSLIKHKIVGIFLIIWGTGFSFPVLAMMPITGVLDFSFTQLLIIAIGMISLGITIFFTFLMDSRTEYGCKILGRIRGFKRFLETARKEELERLVMENPTYFYDILPYTYVLGVSSKWIEKFESINIQSPDWYSGTTTFAVASFGSFMESAMQSAQSSMSSTPASSSGSSGGSSSGGFSGGGSSGGGSGGGGGGSW